MEQFLADWKFTRGLTLKFIKSVPSKKLGFSPSANFGSIGKQLRHMASVQECYIDGIISGSIDFSKKRKDEGMEKSKDKLLVYFKEQDRKLKKLLGKLSIRDLKKSVKWEVWEDLPSPSVYQALLYMREHEVFHQGILQLSADIGGFKCVRFF